MMMNIQKQRLSSKICKTISNLHFLSWHQSFNLLLYLGIILPLSYDSNTFPNSHGFKRHKHHLPPQRGQFSYYKIIPQQNPLWCAQFIPLLRSCGMLSLIDGYNRVVKLCGELMNQHRGDLSITDFLDRINSLLISLLSL